jgi:hypothetical protein
METLMLQLLKDWFARRANARRTAHARRASRRPTLEALEDRQLLSATAPVFSPDHLVTTFVLQSSTHAVYRVTFDPTHSVGSSNVTSFAAPPGERSGHHVIAIDEGTDYAGYAKVLELYDDNKGWEWSDARKAWLSLGDVVTFSAGPSGYSTILTFAGTLRYIWDGNPNPASGAFPSAYIPGLPSEPNFGPSIQSFVTGTDMRGQAMVGVLFRDQTAWEWDPNLANGWEPGGWEQLGSQVQEVSAGTGGNMAVLLTNGALLEHHELLLPTPGGWNPYYGYAPNPYNWTFIPYFDFVSSNVTSVTQGTDGSGGFMVDFTRTDSSARAGVDVLEWRGGNSFANLLISSEVGVAHSMTGYAGYGGVSASVYDDGDLWVHLDPTTLGGMSSLDVSIPVPGGAN